MLLLCVVKRYRVCRPWLLRQFAANVLPIVRQIQAAGATTLAQIAEVLNAHGVQSARGGAWYPSTVKNLLDRTYSSRA